MGGTESKSHGRTRRLSETSGSLNKWLRERSKSLRPAPDEDPIDYDVDEDGGVIVIAGNTGDQWALTKEQKAVRLVKYFEAGLEIVWGLGYYCFPCYEILSSLQYR